MKFTKMEGAGNDYVYVDCFTQKKPGNLSALTKKISDRRYGVGSDGLILILPSKKADARMEMYNCDGSRGAMCGNGIRCVAKYVYDHGIARKKTLRIDTDSGIKTIELEIKSGKVARARVDMGKPIFERKKIPMTGAGVDGLNQEIRVGGKRFKAQCLSMGNPHCVIFVRDEKNFPVEKIASQIQKNPLFPKSVNVEFVRRIGTSEISQRTYERGAGETLACGTGACAGAVATILGGKSKARLLVHLLGGDLEIQWKPGGSVWMTGPAVEVFSGNYEP